MKAGEYVRTRDGIISKIEDDFYTTMCISTDRGKYHYEYFDIIKSSPNIIDLIEEYDVLKFEYDGVEYIADVYAYKGYKEDLAVAGEDIIHIKENNDRFEIKSIVTKEQFSQMEYKL